MQNTMTNEQTYTLKASDLRDLLIGASVAAYAKEDLRKLNAVYLSSEGGELIAVASDRYRLIEGRLASIKGISDFAPIGVSLGNLKALIAALKDIKSSRFHDPELTLSITLAGDILVSLEGNHYTLSNIGEQFPPYNQLFQVVAAPIDAINFNPKFMADFAKVPHDQKISPMLKCIFNGNKHMKVEISHASIKWTALLMPMRMREGN